MQGILGTVVVMFDTTKGSKCTVFEFSVWVFEVAMLAEQAGMHDDNGFTNSSDTGG